MPTLVVTNHPRVWRKLRLSYSSAFKNLAVEEAMARAFSTGTQTKPSIRIWINPKAVVVGRFQEVANEVDLIQCELNQCQVARRFTGGGTVFHDDGTLNFSIVTGRADGSTLDFLESNTRVTLDSLAALGITGTMNPPNSILAEGHKVCGAASAVGRNFTLWHCSILVNTNLQLLELILAPSKTTTSRYVRSRWQPVTTLSKLLSKPLSIDEVAQAIEQSVERHFGIELEEGGISVEEGRLTEALFREKYMSDLWNLKANRGFPPVD